MHACTYEAQFTQTTYAWRLPRAAFDWATPPGTARGVAKRKTTTSR